MSQGPSDPALPSTLQGAAAAPPPTAAGAARPRAGQKSIMRSLGEFFGHIAHAVKADPAKARTAAGAEAGTSPGPRQVTRQTVEEEHRDTPQGKVTLRRTIIEEVELPPGTAPPNAPSGEAGPRP